MRQILERLHRPPEAELARTWAVLGDRARAIACLQKAFAGGYDDPYTILIDAALAPVKDDPAPEVLAPRTSERAS